MIPFDADALLAMLRAFYPTVGPAALLRARSERPEYFAGGEIRGTEGDKLWLGDGRKFDLIFQVNTPQQAWQVLELTNGDGSGGDVDPFALEDGPTSPIDESAFPPPAPATVFQDLVGAQLDALPAHDAALGTAHQTIADAADAGPIDAAFGAFDGDVADGVLGAQSMLAAADPIDVLAATGQSHAMIDAGAASVDETPPGPIGVDDPGGPPPDQPPIDQPAPVPEFPEA